MLLGGASHVSSGRGLRQRASPTGGSANGMPSHLSTSFVRNPRATPRGCTYASITESPACKMCGARGSSPFGNIPKSLRSCVCASTCTVPRSDSASTHTACKAALLRSPHRMAANCEPRRRSLQTALIGWRLAAATRVSQTAGENFNRFPTR